MSFKCQNCGQKIPDKIALGDYVPEGKGVFKHTYNSPDELGTITDFYCSAQCLAEDHDV